MPVSELHGRVAAIALGAVAGHGLARGGGNVLLAHGVITRLTRDVGLSAAEERAVSGCPDPASASREPVD